MERQDTIAENPDLSVTVVMPVFNALPYLDEAIASIVAQTHSDFSFVIYDDHSDDGSHDVALAWAARDPRITVARGARRLGPTGSSNAAAALAQTVFVLRMDADDVAAPDRLQKQLRGLIDCTEAVMIGSTYEMIDGCGKIIRQAQPALIAGASPPFVHSSIFYRRAAFIASGGYREGTDYFEDYDLYRRLARLGSLMIINEPLIKVRFAGQHARLNDDRNRVLAQLSHFATLGAMSRSTSRRVSPTAFRALAMLSVQAGQRPALLGSMIRNVDWSNVRAATTVACYVALAEVSPSCARYMALARSHLIQKWTRQRVIDGQLYTWRFPEDAAHAW